MSKVGVSTLEVITRISVTKTIIKTLVTEAIVEAAFMLVTVIDKEVVKIKTCFLDLQATHI